MRCHCDALGMIDRNSMKLVALLLLCHLSKATRYPCDQARPCGCGASPVEINTGTSEGASVVPFSWSMVVSVRYDFLKNGDSTMHVCGGTILDHSWILTAANCFDSIRLELPNWNITIAAGIHRRSQASGIIRKVDEVILHPNWTSEWRSYLHDIALLRLSVPLDFENHSTIARTCLPPRRATLEETLQYPSNNQSLVVVGWGRITADGNNSDALQQISVYSVNDDTTECVNGTEDPFSQFCAGSMNDPSGTCYGDFGGPIFQWQEDHWQQVGIASQAIDGCTNESLVGYTRVAYYDKWITMHMSNDTSSITSLMPTSSTTVGPVVYECDRNEVTCGCGQHSVELLSSRILNGQEAVPYSWSMVVSIRFRGSDKHVCGGSILGESHILTSASCIADAPVFGITIAGGTHNYSEGFATHRRVDGVVIHPDYTGPEDNYINDIAILHLSQPLDLPFDTYLAQTCLSPAVSTYPDPIYYPSSEALLAVVAWGYTNYQNRTEPYTLHQAEVYAAKLSDPNCTITDTHSGLQFCAGVEQGGKVPCVGDSGSPIFQWYGNRWQQVGLVSSVSSCERPGALGLYTRLVTYYDWIQSIMNGWPGALTSTTTTTTVYNGQPSVFYQCDRNSTCGCGSTPVVLSQSRIVGGEEAIAHSWPMVVSLRFRTPDPHDCGATILSESYILTAAHCLQGYSSGPVSDVTIVAGTTNLLDSRRIQRSVDRVHIHPGYINSFGNYQNDIALLHLNQSLPIESTLFLTKSCIHRINPPTVSSQYIKNATRLTVIGWGTTQGGLVYTPDTLRQVEVFAIDNNDPACLKSIQNPELQFCAGIYEGGKDSCQGDSGGPIFQWQGSYWEQVGVVSYGTGCAEPGNPGVYTRLSYYYDWISEIMKMDNEYIEPRDPSNLTTTLTTTTTTLNSTAARAFQVHYLNSLYQSAIPLLMVYPIVITLLIQ